MSLKAELEVWDAALKAYDKEDFENALQLFLEIAETSKIYMNIGLIYATIGNHHEAVQSFDQAIRCDAYFAAAQFQRGVSCFLLERYEDALYDFEKAYSHLRDNLKINYEQLGLRFQLYAAEVIFNIGLCHVYLGNTEKGLQRMREADLKKVTPEHAVIQEAIREEADGYNVFSIAAGIVFRPSQNRTKNMKTKDFLGTAKLIAVHDAADAFTTFSGVTLRDQGLKPSRSPLAADFVRPAPRRSSLAQRKDLPRFPVLQLSAASTAPIVSTPAPSSSTLLPPPKPDFRGPASPRAAHNRSWSAEALLTPSVSSFGQVGNDMQLPQSNVQASAPSPARPQLPTIAPLSIPSRPIPAQSRSAVEDAQPTYFPLRYRRVETPSVGPPPRALDIATKTLPSPRGTVKGSYAVDDRLSEDGRDAVMTRPSNLDWSMRLTEFYDSYGDMGSTDTDSYPPSQGLHSANPTLPPVPRLLPPPMSVYSGSTLSSRSRTTGGRPKPSRRGMSRVSSRFPQDAYYDEDEEGYISGEYSDEIPDIVSIRVKITYGDEVRGMAISPNLSFRDFAQKIDTKFHKSSDELLLKFEYDDGAKIALQDDDDYELAIETARASARGYPTGKLSVWVFDY